MTTTWTICNNMLGVTSYCKRGNRAEIWQNPYSKQWCVADHISFNGLTLHDTFDAAILYANSNWENTA